MRFLSTGLIIIVAILSGCSGGGDPPNGGSSGGRHTSVVVTPANGSVYQAQTIQFQAQVIGQSNQTVIWRLQDNFGTIDSTGLYTAPHDGYGTTAVIATSQAVPDAIGSVNVNVLPVQVIISPS